MAKANNTVHRDDFVWFATTNRAVMGIVTLEFYVHTHRAVRAAMCAYVCVCVCMYVCAHLCLSLSLCVCVSLSLSLS
jgi:hypothetical protein